jgi:hypothetical protein
MDEHLIELMHSLAENWKMNLTDVIEEGCWSFMQKQTGQKMDLESLSQGRFLWKVLPMYRQKQVLAFCAFFEFERGDTFQEMFRQQIDQYLEVYRTDPGTDYTTNLARLGVTYEQVKDNAGSI